MKASGAASGPAPDRPVFEAIPAWLTWTLVLACAALISYAVIGMTSAMVGAFRPQVVVPLTAVTTLVLGRRCLRELDHLPAVSSRAHLLSGLVVLGAVLWMGWNAMNHAEPLLIQRDPGVYATTGAWMADHGDLHVAGLEGPFRSDPSLRLAGQGFHPEAGWSLQPQFPHLTATFLAGAAWMDDVRMFVVNPVLAGSALVVLYALGTRLCGRWGAAVGVALFACTYPLLHFSRSTYSEPLALLLLFSGLWALSLALDRRGVALGVLAGALLGATCMVRIDGFVQLIPIAGCLAAALRLAHDGADRRSEAAIKAVALAMVATASLGALETWLFSRSYFTSDLAPRLPWLVASAVGLAVALWSLAPRLWRQEGRQDVPTRTLQVVMAASCGLIVLFALWARFLRPDFDGLRALIAQELPSNMLGPKAWTTSYLWLEWYLGPLLTAVGLASLLWIALRGLRSPRRDVALTFSTVALAATLLYLVRPSITPDHPWAMRRFLPVTLPALCLAAGVAGQRLVRRHPRPIVILGVAAAIGAAGWSITATTRPFLDENVGHPIASRFDQICAIADEEPSAILVTSDRLLAATIPQSLQVWCDVPVAGATTGTSATDVLALDRAWSTEGRRLLLLATSPLGIDGATGPGVGLPETFLEGPRSRFDGPPVELTPDQRLAQASDGRLPLFVIDVAEEGEAQPAP